MELLGTNKRTRRAFRGVQVNDQLPSHRTLVPIHFQHCPLYDNGKHWVCGNFDSTDTTTILTVLVIILG